MNKEAERIMISPERYQELKELIDTNPAKAKQELHALYRITEDTHSWHAGHGGDILVGNQTVARYFEHSSSNLVGRGPTPQEATRSYLQQLLDPDFIPEGQSRRHSKPRYLDIMDANHGPPNYSWRHARIVPQNAVASLT